MTDLDAAIRARLDELGDPEARWLAHDAIRAVLDLLDEPVHCAHYEDPLYVRTREIERAIADALGA